ncbi:MAG: hypothetical protein EX271_01595 [Acidimicrobiales bacterium]|nr:hypothetical protein [Hyphomonadaceae bacterium]RZV44505.1 MAG: hypothetical protein EX271_01595 [Acidimicrobiales bacterium]
MLRIVACSIMAVPLLLAMSSNSFGNIFPSKVSELLAPQDEGGALKRVEECKSAEIGLRLQDGVMTFHSMSYLNAVSAATANCDLESVRLIQYQNPGMPDMEILHQEQAELLATIEALSLNDAFNGKIEKANKTSGNRGYTAAVKIKLK